MMRSRTLAAAAAAVLSGCAHDAGSAGFTLTDSAGVAIALNEPKAEPPMWSLSARPATVLGDEAAGDEPLFRINEVRLGADGRVVVAHGGGHEVRAYAADGTLMWVAGRDGDGPGEFRMTTRLDLLPGDTAAVVDLRTRRLTLLDPAGGLVSVTPLTFTQPEPPRDVVWIPALTPLGTEPDHGVFALLRVMVRLQKTPGARVMRGALARFDATGAAGDSLGAPTVSHVYETPGDRIPIESTAFSVVFRSAVAGGRLYISDTSQWDVDVYDGRGRLLRVIREARARRPLTPEIIARLPTLPAGMPTPTHYPDSIPAIGKVVADRDGRVWAVASTVQETDPAEARIYDARGRLVGRLALPGHFALMDVREDRLVGVQKDDMDVETVVVYTFEQGEG